MQFIFNFPDLINKSKKEIPDMKEVKMKEFKGSPQKGAISAKNYSFY